MMDLNQRSLARKAIDLLISIPEAERHAIATENNETITALAFLAQVTCDPLGVTASDREALNALRVAAETLFALGYKAGQQDNVKVDPEIWG